MVSIPVLRPWQMVAFDIVGPFKPTRRGHTHILTLMEYFTKWPEAIALKSTDSRTIARALISLFCRFGLPEQVLSDRGPNLVSEVMTSAWKMMGIKKKMTTSHHPQTDGMLERFHRTLEAILSKTPIYSRRRLG
jgi:hypothetical protein